MKFKEIRHLSSPVLRAGFWTVAGFAANQFLRLLSNLILTRLVQPEAFGLMAVVTVVIVGVEMLTDLGINTSVVQNRRGDDQEFVNTAFTLRVVRGGVMAVIVAGMALPLALFYQQPELVYLLPAVAIVVLISGFSSLSLAVASRRLWLGRATLIPIIGQVVATASAAAYAYRWPSVWALIVGYAASMVTVTVLSHLAFPMFRSRLAWNRVAAMEIVAFGKWMFLTSCLVFISSQIDKMFLASVAPIGEVGLYSIAFMWAQLPTTAAQTWFGRLVLPIASEELRSPAPNYQRMRKHRRHVVGAVAVVVSALGIAFDPVFHLLYPQEYWPATAFIRVLLAGAMLRTLDESYRIYNLAAGAPKYTAVGSFLTVAVFLVTVVPFFSLLGTVGVAASYAVSQLGTLAASAFGAHRRGISDIGFDLILTIPTAVFIILGIYLQAVGIP